VALGVTRGRPPQAGWISGITASISGRRWYLSGRLELEIGQCLGAAAGDGIAGKGANNVRRV